MVTKIQLWWLPIFFSSSLSPIDYDAEASNFSIKYTLVDFNWIWLLIEIRWRNGISVINSHGIRYAIYAELAPMQMNSKTILWSFLLEHDKLAAYEECISLWCKFGRTLPCLWLLRGRKAGAGENKENEYSDAFEIQSDQIRSRDSQRPNFINECLCKLNLYRAIAQRCQHIQSSEANLLSKKWS